MTTTKEEALKHLDELEKKIDLELKDAHELELDLRKEKENEVKKLSGQVLNLTVENGNLKKKLEGYTELQKALSKIRVEGGVSEDRVREIARQEASKVGAITGPTEGTAEFPTLNVNVDRPDVIAEDTSLRGGLAILLQEGFFDKNRSIGNAKTRLNGIGLVHSEKDIEVELIKFCQWRLLEMDFTDRRVFKATDGAKDRIKLR